MPEGHTIHRLARDHGALLTGKAVRLASPQGRFAEGAARLDGRELIRVEAYGKHLFYDFGAGDLLHVHLGLYGSWTGGFGEPPPPRGALRLRLTSGRAWLDLRGPTACELMSPPERSAVLARLGPDPLRPRADPARAWARLSRSSAPVAALLMDQSVLAGVGNVYRAELLFRAACPPYLAGRDLPRPAWDALWTDLTGLMRRGVKLGRIVTTDRADRTVGSGPARADDAHYVYRRTGLACRRCATPVATAVLAGRNLFWCERCQA